MHRDGNEEWVGQRLGRYARFGVELGLSRIQTLLEALGNPQHQVPIVHVAGSNGKGSVCAYLASTLAQAGYRVGRYTSPHLVSWCERIHLNTTPIPPQDLAAALDRVEAAMAQHWPDADAAVPRDSPTQFEVITAAAWVYFAQQALDIAVIEVGLGGRLDATNVVPHPLVSVITSISREHWQRLGPTLAAIAGEKAGILKARRPAVIGNLPDEAEQVVLERAAALDCPTIRPGAAQIDDQGYAVYTPHRPDQGTITYGLPLPGKHQLANSAVAIATLHCLRDQGWSIDDQAIQTGLTNAQWPGRLQWLRWRSPEGEIYPWLLDGAHNPAAAHELRGYVEAIYRGQLSPLEAQSLSHLDISLPDEGSTSWLIGMLTTKDHADVLQALLRPGDHVHLVPVPGHASAALDQLATIAQRVCPTLATCHTHSNLAEGLNAAIAAPSTLRVLCGSLYLVGHFFQTQSHNTVTNYSPASAPANENS